VSFKGSDRKSEDLEYIVYNYQVKGDSHRFEDVGHMVDGGFVQCRNAKNCRPAMIFSDGTSKIPDVKMTADDTPYETISIAASALFVGFVLMPSILCLCKCLRQRKEKKEKQKAKALLHSRLLKNWSALLSSPWVDDLSHMPEEWKSGIVPCRSPAGRALKHEMQDIGKQVENISNRCWYCGNKMEEKKLLELKKSIEDFMQRNVAVFYEERHEMYKSYLLENPELTTTTKTKNPKQSASENTVSKSQNKGATSKEPTTTTKKQKKNKTKKSETVGIGKYGFEVAKQGSNIMCCAP